MTEKPTTNNTNNDTPKPREPDGFQDVVNTEMQAGGQPSGIRTK